MNVPHYLKRLLDNRHGQMSPVIDKTSYIILWHLWELLLEDAFQSSQDDEAFAGIVVVYDSKLYLPSALFDNSRL